MRTLRPDPSDFEAVRVLGEIGDLVNGPRRRPQAPTGARSSCRRWPPAVLWVGRSRWGGPTTTKWEASWWWLAHSSRRCDRSMWSGWGLVARVDRRRVGAGGPGTRRGRGVPLTARPWARAGASQRPRWRPGPSWLELTREGGGGDEAQDHEAVRLVGLVTHLLEQSEADESGASDRELGIEHEATYRVLGRTITQGAYGAVLGTEGSDANGCTPGTTPTSSAWGARERAVALPDPGAGGHER